MSFTLHDCLQRKCITNAHDCYSNYKQCILIRKFNPNKLKLNKVYLYRKASQFRNQLSIVRENLRSFDNKSLSTLIRKVAVDAIVVFTLLFWPTEVNKSIHVKVIM